MNRRRPALQAGALPTELQDQLKDSIDLIVVLDELVPILSFGRRTPPVTIDVEWHLMYAITHVLVGHHYDVAVSAVIA